MQAELGDEYWLRISFSALIWRVFRQSDDIKQKNDVIVREVRRNQLLIHNGSFREPSES